MGQQVILLRETTTPVELAERAISAVLDGEIDPITAYINISRMERAIALFKDSVQVRDVTLCELSKYDKRHLFGDCQLEQAESGVRYDYSMCGDSTYADMLQVRTSIDADIKEREKTLKNLPASGMVNIDTGEVVYPPVKSSKTVVKVTFKK